MNLFRLSYPRFKCIIAIWLGYFLYFQSSFVHALTPIENSKQPIHISSERMTYDDLKQLSIFYGNVIITQGSLQIQGQRVEIKQDPQGYRYIHSFGDQNNPALFRKKRVNHHEYIEGTAKEIDYNGKLNLTTLKEQAVVKRLNQNQTVIDTVHGAQISYDGIRDIYHASNSADGTSRVHAVFNP